MISSAMFAFVFAGVLLSAEVEAKSANRRVRTSEALIDESDGPREIAQPWVLQSGVVSSVLELNRFIFGGNILRGEADQNTANWVVVFCPNWWEPCQNIAEPFAELAKRWQTGLNIELLANKVRFARVDCATDKVLCNEQDVETYPTVLHYAGGKRVAKWQGGQKQDAEQLQKWLDRQLGPSLASAGVAAALEKHLSFRELISQYLTPGERAADIFLAFIGIVASIRLVLSNPELWGKNGVPQTRGAQPEASGVEASEPQTLRRRWLPASWAAARPSVNL